ncbi:uncharacterized protein EpC_32890 [Erwinia pyrifoliae Ep1/96]|nr:hypothetical protein CPI84_01970 [Erwinia pyrifoliae]CAX57068.1 uncharacterized protein EpC_32890 [Erwinia pyrifoliae Ep1/96]
MWPPSLAAQATALPSGSCRPYGLRLQGFMPARLRLSVTARGRSSFLLARSRSGQLPLPAPACAGHAKPSVPLTFRASERRRAVLAGLASPRPADASSSADRLRTFQRRVAKR